jgi:glycosyltransferase involved in cell wall biosynthesis
MKVLLLNTYDIRGGAARATFRVFEALKTVEGVHTRYLVQTKESRDPDVLGPSHGFSSFAAGLRPYVDFILPYIFTRKRIPFFPAIIPGRIVDKINQIDPDIVHMNWMSGGFMKIESLARIDKPIVWTMHDMWAFTGGCHYAEDCLRYTNHCGKCPILNSHRENDLSSWIFQRKLETYGQLKKLKIITVSNWLADCVRKSRLLGNKPVEVFPNLIDTHSFRPHDRIEARKTLGLQPDQKYILFGAINATSNKLKGYELLLQALQALPAGSARLIVFGAGGNKTEIIGGMAAQSFGHIADDKRLGLLYSAADVMVVPSIQEAFGQTATEAMACGTPVVAFGSTGLLDIVVHKKTGYLAKPYDPVDLAQGILWCMSDEARQNELSLFAREHVMEKFDSSRRIYHLVDIYKNVISKAAVL